MLTCSVSGCYVVVFLFKTSSVCIKRREVKIHSFCKINKTTYFVHRFLKHVYMHVFVAFSMNYTSMERFDYVRCSVLYNTRAMLIQLMQLVQFLTLEIEWNRLLHFFLVLFVSYFCSDTVREISSKVKKIQRVYLGWSRDLIM